EMPPAFALEHLAVPRDEHDVVGRHLVEAEPCSLHPDAATFGIARRHVAPDEVALLLGVEDPAPERDVGLRRHRRRSYEGPGACPALRDGRANRVRLSCLCRVA